MTPELETAVAHAYSVFASYRVRRDLDFAARVSASDREHARLRRTLAEIPLRELPADAIDAYFEYIDAAHYDGAFRADEVRYFLPRALETIACREARPWLHERIERMLERGQADTRWPPAETQAVARVLAALA